ncbi:CPBP family intramembrane metalloprotease [Candidatus Saccharibacteria bacterium]|nr:MAG: CPBP family intramembrane metalloprotease [Candidatus Saccharibacteria bacterium]
MPNEVNLTEDKTIFPGEPKKSKTPKDRGWRPLPAVLWTLFLYIAPQVAAASILVFILSALGWSSERATDWLQNAVSAQFYYILVAELLTLSGIYWLLRTHRKTWKHLGLISLRLADVWKAVQGFGAYVVVYIVVASVVGALIPSLDVEQEQQIGFEAARSGIDLLLVFSGLVMLAPLAEEIVFRGYLFTSLRSKFSFLYATLITSTLFGAAHLQFGSGEPLLWIAAIDTAVLSGVMCYMREKTGSLWPAIFIHAMKNMVAFSYLFLFK